MNIYYIYKATNIINGKVYIGFTSNWPNRVSDHYASAYNKNSPLYLHRAIRKHGWDNFTWEVIYSSLDSNHCLNVMENHFIVEERSYIGFDDCNGYNMTLGGEGCLGRLNKQPHEANVRRSESLKGRYMSPDHRMKIGLARKGTKFSDEWRSNISQSRKGRKFSSLSEDHKQKISSSNRKPKVRCCCISCSREISVNNLARHLCDIS